jgi:hypothetical protein
MVEVKYLIFVCLDERKKTVLPDQIITYDESNEAALSSSDKSKKKISWRTSENSHAVFLFLLFLSQRVQVCIFIFIFILR